MVLNEEFEAPDYCQLLGDIYIKEDALFESDSQIRKVH
jgi:hypothetical protein